VFTQQHFPPKYPKFEKGLQAVSIECAMGTKNTSRIFLSAVIYFTFTFHLLSQNGIEPSKLKQFNITVNFEDYTVKTQMLSQNKKITVSNDRSYMWYTSQKIMETKGGYDGKLIHGTYRAFYLNNQLKEKGCIKYGLKHSQWKYWYADGKLKEVINWKKGVKNGSYYLYNDYGQLMAKSNFKNDKLHGSFYTYGTNGKLLEKKKYRNGEEIAAKVKTNKKLFRGRKKEPTLSLKDAGTKKESFLKRLFKKNNTAPKEKPAKEKKKTVTS
jgi:hypothetical protein